MHDLVNRCVTTPRQCHRLSASSRRTARRVQLIAAPAVVGRDWHQHRDCPAKTEARSVWPLLLPLLAIALVGSWLAP